MKIPKRIKRLCPKCGKHTEHTVKNQTNRGLNKTNTMTRGAINRVMARGLRRGTGNQGRFSRKPIGSWKMTGQKTTKKLDLRYTCTECKKTHMQKAGIRVKRVELI